MASSSIYYASASQFQVSRTSFSSMTSPLCSTRRTPAAARSTPSSSFSGTPLRARGLMTPTGSYQVSSRGAPRTRSMWIDNRAEVVAEIPVEEAFKMWEDRERIPRWMPWISSVKVQPNQPELSRWTLRWEAFNQNIELTWMARNMQPTLNQKIHWRSVDGLANRGIVRFYKTGRSSCRVEMTISYEVPDFLLPFATALGPLVESIIKGDLDRFAKYAKEHGHSLKELEAS